MKKIGLIDVDYKRGTNIFGTKKLFPNLALMKISAYYKRKGYKVEWYSPLFHKDYEKIFASKVFKWESPVDPYLKKDMIIGGSGYSLKEKLPSKIEHIYPDYKLYHINYAMGFLCYDKETQVLTNKGWKYFRNLSFQDKVLTLDPNTENIEYQRPIEIINERYNGELIHFENKYIDLLVTPNHRLYLKTRRSKKEKEYFYFRRADDVEKLYSFRFKKDGIWSGKEREYFYLPKISNYRNTCNLIEKISMDLWLEFLGYYISEGNTQYKEKRNAYIIKISQSKKSKYFNKFEECIKKLGLNYYIGTSGDFYLSNKQLYKYLKLLGKSYEKYIPQDLLDLSKRQLKILWDAIYLGDGTHFTKSKTQGICTSSYKLASNLQELLLKIGYCGDIRLVREKGTKTYFKKEDRYIIARHNQYVIFKNTHYVNPNHFGKTSGKTERKCYRERVYCCSVPNEIIYVRRHGKAVWCGNTRGCIRACLFCIVPLKEGYIRKNTDLEEFWRGQDHIMLLDNNILAYKKHLELLKILKETDKKIDFNQGLDIRLITPENAQLLREIKRWEGTRYRFAFDWVKLKPIIEQKLRILNEAGIQNTIISFYVLIGFNTTIEQDLMRINFLKERRILAFVMPFNKSNTYQKALTKYVNKHFYKVCNFREYLESHGTKIQKNILIGELKSIDLEVSV
nr:MAG: radical SAM superfamily enzyme with an N-terminal intein homing endonuclease [uncultured archaeon]